MIAPDDEAFGLETHEEAEVPPPDLLFRAVADSSRRRLLAVLATEPEISLEELTDILVGAASTTGGPVGPDDRKRVAVELRHTHLPLLADAGLLRYDDGVVRSADYPDPVADLLGFASEYEEAAASGPDGRD